MYSNGTKKLKNLGRRFHEWKLVWSFGLIYSVKRVKNSEKNATFQNWLKVHPKTETHEPNVYPTILGGVSQGFWSPFLDWGAGSAIFLHLKTGTFVKSARFQVPKNGPSSAPIYKQTPKTLRNTSQIGGVDIWVMRFHFWASIEPNFKNCIFSTVFDPFFTYMGQKLKVWCNRPNIEL